MAPSNKRFRNKQKGTKDRKRRQSEKKPNKNPSKLKKQKSDPWTWDKTANTNPPQKVDPTNSDPEPPIKKEAGRIVISVLPPHIQKPHVFDFINKVARRPPIDIYLRHLTKYNVLSEAIVALDNQHDIDSCCRELFGKKLEGVEVKVYPLVNERFEKTQNVMSEFDDGYSMESVLEYQHEWKRLSLDFKDKTPWMEWNNLATTVTEQDILNHIQQSGLVENPPKDVLLYQHPVNEEYPGFARIQCDSAEDASKLIEGLHLSQLQGQRIWMEWKRFEFDYPVVQHSGYRYEELKEFTRTVEILNLHYVVNSEKTLRKLVSPYGEVNDVLLFRFPNGHMQRRAVVQMKTIEGAQNVWNKLHRKRVRGSQLWIELRPDDYGTAQFARKLLMENKEKNRRVALKRLKQTGDERSGLQKEKDRLQGSGWRDGRSLGQIPIRVKDLEAMKMEGRLRIDPKSLKANVDKRGYFKLTRKYGTAWVHRRADLLGIKRARIEVSSRWGAKYVS